MEKATQPSKRTVDLNTQSQKEALKDEGCPWQCREQGNKTDRIMPLTSILYSLFHVFMAPNERLPIQACVSSLDVLHATPVTSTIRIWPEAGNVLALGPEQALYELNLLPRGFVGLPAPNHVLPPLNVGILAKKNHL